MKHNLRELLLPLALLPTMAVAVWYDAPRMFPHSGGELSMAVIAVSLLTAGICGVRAIGKRRWLCAALMALVILCCFGCDRWLHLQVPPCSECDPALYAEWLEDANKG